LLNSLVNIKNKQKKLLKVYPNTFRFLCYATPLDAISNALIVVVVDPANNFHLDALYECVRRAMRQ
jgi:hypothetical protein